MSDPVNEASITARQYRDDPPVYSERYVASLRERARQDRERYERERRKLQDELVVARAMVAEARRKLAGVARTLG